MNIDKLRDIVSRKDGEEFCQFFRQLKPEDILKLSQDEYQEIMSLAHQMGRDKIIRDDSFFAFFFEKGIRYSKNASLGRDVLQSAQLSLFYYNLYLNIYYNRDKNLASALANKGISLQILAEHGINAIANLKKSIKCYNEGALIFKREGPELDYARTLTNKGISFRILAEQGVNTIANLDESLKYCDEAALIFQREKAEVDYARTLMNKGNTLRILAQQGVNIVDNLLKSISCHDEAASIFHRKGVKISYARAVMHKGISLLRLAEQRADPIKNLEKSLDCYDEAAPIFQMERAELSYARTLMNKGNSLVRLAELGVNIIDNLEKSINCYDEAAPIFKRERAELDYARTLMNKGFSLRILAEQRVETIIKNLEESVKCYDDAAPIFNREKADLDYAGVLMNKGISLCRLAELGVDVERNFAAAMQLYQETESIFLEKGSLLIFVMASSNHIIGLWWRFQETNKEDYLIQARSLCEKALEAAPQITHPARYSIIALLNRINAILADKYLASDKPTLQEILKYVKRLPFIEKKIEFISDSIKFHTKQIIDKIRESGAKVSEEVAKSFTSLADDLRVTDDEQQRKLLEKLCRLLTDPTFQKKLLRESPPEKKGSIKSIFQRIKKTAKEVVGHMPAALAAHQIFYYFDWLWVEVLHLTPLHPALVLGMVLSPFIAFKDSLSKN